MSSDQQLSINSLSFALSESLGLQGGASANSTGAGDVLSEQPLPESVQSQVEPQSDNNNSSTMDTHNTTNQLPLTPSLAVSSPNDSSDYHQSATPSSSASTSSSPLHAPRSPILDEEYRMDRPNRGLCLIFNHEHFIAHSRRQGTGLDAYSLRGCFEKLGFNCTVHDDLHRDELKKVLTDVSLTDHSNSDCFVCCFLTHGDEDGNLHAKDITYSKRDVIDLFTGEKCPSLNGKPKIFFIQACRGKKTDHGVSLEYETDAAFTIAAPNNQTQTLPVSADFLIAYSTSEGFYSYRNTISGGPFVQRLVKNLEKYGAQEDLLVILTRVNREVAAYEAKVGTGPIGKQSPQIVYTLTKSVIFRQKPNQMAIPSAMSYRLEHFNQDDVQGASNYPELN